VVNQISYPGEACSSNSQCYNSQACTRGFCNGLAYLSTCSTHEQCAPGLRCGQNLKCVPQIDIGISGCRDANDCVNSASCNATYSSLNGICFQYASVPLGQIVTDCAYGFSYLCSTGTCQKVGTDYYASLGVCVEAPASMSKLPTNCTMDTDCQGTNGIDIFLSTCSCGFNKLGTAFCQPFIGDQPGVNFITTWVSALKKTDKKCNTARRTTSQCLQVVGAYDDTLVAT